MHMPTTVFSRDTWAIKMSLWKYRRGVVLLSGGFGLLLLYLLYTRSLSGGGGSAGRLKSHLKSTFHDKESEMDLAEMPMENGKDEKAPLGKDATVMIIGDSHIAHLNDAISQGVIDNAKKDFDSNHKVIMHGVPGATVDVLRNYQKLIYMLKSERPQLVILHVGGNDADSKAPVDEISGNILKYSIELEMVYGVNTVIISEQFHRKKPRLLPNREYDLKIVELNKQLKFHDSTRFWGHNELRQAPQDILGEDGVHLNEYGQKYFYNSIRLALTDIFK